MLEALVSGDDDPKALAALAKGALRQKLPLLEEALKGLVGAHQRMLLGSQLKHLAFLEGQVEELDREVAERMCPFEEALHRLDAIPGVGQRVAEEILGEIGLDMRRFPSPAHLSSWARVCAVNNESAGERKSASTGHGNPWLRAALVEAAWAAARSKDTYLSAQYHRLAARRGAKRAIAAVAHSILIIIYHLLNRGTTYKDLGANYFDERDRQTAIRRAVQRIQRLGYKVTLEAA